ncbi:hypothetical protein PENTCL1PPCAC_14435 [Pristionchus entomophagus]|uniref:RING-type domain-containing protein n=1 Tax=Pristionchus entomophagus TaxID=358040 RepID=A0AAV5TAS9_9BILA|nr:hypothetical protein PENTCL1PPCAC_14435 [Pristionchus entomophagus]
MRGMLKRECILLNDIPEDTDIDDDDVIDDEHHYVSLATVISDLNSLVLRKDKRDRGAKRVKPRYRFIDEILKPVFVPSPRTRGIERDDDPKDDETRSPAPARVMSIPNEMTTGLPLASVPPRLHAAPRLACFPPTWEIHAKGSLRLLGQDMSSCVIAKEYGEELRLFTVEDCSSTHPLRLLLPFPTLDEKPPIIHSADVDHCEICDGEMDMRSDVRLSHLFAFSCPHIFCSGCWLAHISESIHNRKLPAACLQPSCPLTVSFSAAKGLLSSRSNETYELTTIDVLKAVERLITCPECKRLLYTNRSLSVACPCGASLCSQCSSISSLLSVTSLRSSKSP